MPLVAPRFAGDAELEECLDGTHIMEAPEFGDAVTKVQQALLDLGYGLPVHGPDGQFGDETGSAVSEFKSDMGLSPADPRVGPGTMAALDAAFAGETPATPPTAPDFDPAATATAAIELKRAQLASTGQDVGAATSTAIGVAGTDGFQQSYEDATFYWSSDTDANALSGTIDTRYIALGGPASFLSFPTMDQTQAGSGEYATFSFQGSGLLGVIGSDVHEVHGLIGERYWQAAGPDGYLGYPTSDETPAGDGAFSRFEFQGAGVLWHPVCGVHEVHGAIGEHYWDSLGGPTGAWGFPVSDEYDAGGGARASDFQRGTLFWTAADGVTEFPKQTPVTPTFSAWLTSVPDAPNGAGKTQPQLTDIPVPGPVGTQADITLIYVDPNVAATAPSSDPDVVALCQQIDMARELIGVVPGLHNVSVREQGNGSTYLIRGYQFVGKPVPLTTTLTSDEALATTGTTLPAGVSAEDLRSAELDVWHDLSGNEGDPSAINAYDSVNLTWGGGFAAAGQLQSLISSLFARSATARGLFLEVGMSVEQVSRVPMFVAVDTGKRWKLYNKDAERYIRADKRLLSLLIRIAQGSVPDSLFPSGSDVAGANEALSASTLDAQFHHPDPQRGQASRLEPARVVSCCQSRLPRVHASYNERQPDNRR